MKICAGIVTYNPDILLLKKNIEAIYNQVETVFVVDNASVNIEEFAKKMEQYKRLIFLKNSNNMGIACALNQLCDAAEKDDYDFILTLDQDSICSDDCILQMQKWIKPNVGIICPRIDFVYDNSFIVSTISKNGEKISACITSGSLTSLQAWKNVKGFDEWMFIDHVDDDFCMRLRLGGFQIIRVNDAVLQQRAGNMSYLKFPFGIKLRLFCYSPLRVYYITRNTLYFIRKYWNYIPKLKEIVKFSYSTLYMFLFEKNRFKVFPSFCRGFKDGIKVRIA